MNDVFETVAEVFEELRSEAEGREYYVQTKEAENANIRLKKAKEEQRAYYQGMLDVIQIFDGLGIIKKSNKITELLYKMKK